MHCEHPFPSAALCLATWMSFCGCIAADEGKPGDAKNLIAEPSFEGRVLDAGLPAGWFGLHAVPEEGYRFAIADEGKTGKKSLLIEGKGKYGVAWGEKIAID